MGAESRDIIENSLKDIAQQVENEANAMESLSIKLSEVISLYKRSEQSIKKNVKFAGLQVGLIDTSVVDKVNDDTNDNKEYWTNNGTKFKIGEPQQPKWEVYSQYDNDFPYDPNAEATYNDYLNWAKWKVLNEGAQYGGWVVGRNMPDAIEAYEHYRSGEGTDLEIDYAKAYNEDCNIKKAVDQYITETQKMVENMLADGQKPPFSISGDLMPIGNPYYPETENWQKAIGAHNIWISADVTLDKNGNICMNTTVYEIDRYNFNSGMSDIASGASDNENGRFEELGWAKSFNTVGSFNMDVQWKQGDIDGGTFKEMESGR